MLKWTSKGSLNAQERVSNTLPPTSWPALEAAGERDVNLLNKIIVKSTAGQELDQINSQTFARPFSNSFTSDAFTAAQQNLLLVSAPNSPLSKAKDFFGYQSISLPASPERGSNPSVILDGKKSKSGMFKKLKKLFRKPKSKDLKNTPLAIPTLKTKRSNPVMVRTMSSIDGVNMAPKTRLVRLIESKKAQRKSKRSLLEKKYTDESESYSSDDNRVQNHSFVSEAKHFDIFASPCPSLNSLVAQLSLDAPEYVDVVSVSSMGSKPYANLHNSVSISMEQDFLAADRVPSALQHDIENGGTTIDMVGLHHIDQPRSVQGVKKKHYSASDSNSTSFFYECDENSGMMTDRSSDKTPVNENTVPMLNRNSIDTGSGVKSLDAESEFRDQSPGRELHGSDSSSSLHKFAKILEVIKQSGSFEKVKVMPTSPDKIIQIKLQLSPVTITNSNSSDTVQMASSLDQWSWQEESQFLSPVFQDNSSDDQNESDQKEAYNPLQPPYTRNNNNGHHTYHHDMVTTPYMVDSTVREAISYGDAGIEPSRVSSLVKSFQDHEKMASSRRPQIQAYTRVDQLQDTGLVCVRDTVKRITSAGQECRGVSKNENSHFSQASPEGKEEVNEHEHEDFEMNRKAPKVVLCADAKVTIKTPKMVRFLLHDESINKTVIPVEKYDGDSADDNESCSASDVAECDAGPSFNSSNPFSEEFPSDSNVTFTSDTNAFCSDVSDPVSDASYPKEILSENSGKYEPSLCSVVQLVCDSFIASIPDNDTERWSAGHLDSQTDGGKTHENVQENYTDLPRHCESRSPLTNRPLQHKTDLGLQLIDDCMEQADADKMAVFDGCAVSEHDDGDKIASFEGCMVSEQAGAEEISSPDAKVDDPKIAISPTLDNNAVTLTKTKFPSELVCVSPSEYEECITDVRAPNLMLIQDFSPVEPNMTSPVDKSSLESPHPIVNSETSPLEKNPSEVRAPNMEPVVGNVMGKRNGDNVDNGNDTDISLSNVPLSNVPTSAGKDNKLSILSTEEFDGTADVMPDYDAKVNVNGTASDTPDFKAKVNINESTTKKKRVSFQLESPSPDWSSQSDDIAIMEITLQQKDKSADEAAVAMGNESSTDISFTESSIESKAVQDLEYTVPLTSNSVDDVSWWGNEVLEDIEFFYERKFKKYPDTKCQTEEVIDSVQQSQPNSATPSNDSSLHYEATENSHNADSEQEKLLTLSKFLSTESAFINTASQSPDLKSSAAQLEYENSLVSSDDDVVLKFVQGASPGTPKRHHDEMLPIQELSSENVIDESDMPLVRDSDSGNEITSEEKKNTESEINTLTYNVLRDDVDKKRAWWDGPNPAKSDADSVMNLERVASSSFSDYLSQSDSFVDVDSNKTSPGHENRCDKEGNNLVLESSPFGLKLSEPLSGPDYVMLKTPEFGSLFTKSNKKRQMFIKSKLKHHSNSSLSSSQADGNRGSPINSFKADTNHGRPMLVKGKLSKIKMSKLKPVSGITGKPNKFRIKNLYGRNNDDKSQDEANEVLDLSPLEHTQRVKVKNAINEKGRQERKIGSGVGITQDKASKKKRSAGINSGEVVAELSSPPKMTSYECVDQGVEKGSLQRKSVDSIYSQSFYDQCPGNWDENGSGDSEFSVSSASFRTESLHQVESMADTVLGDTVLQGYLRKGPRNKRKSTETKNDFSNSTRTKSMVSTSIPGEFTSSSDTGQVWEQSRGQAWEQHHYLNKNDFTASLCPYKMCTFAQAVGERFEGTKSEKLRSERSLLSGANNEKSLLSGSSHPIISATHTCLQKKTQPLLEDSDADVYSAPDNRNSSLSEKKGSKNVLNTGKGYVPEIRQQRKNGYIAKIFPLEIIKKANLDELEDTVNCAPADNYETQHGGPYRTPGQPPTHSTDPQNSSLRSLQLSATLSDATRSPGRVKQGRSNPPQVPSQTGQVSRKSKSKLEHQPGEWLFIATFFIFQLLMHWLYAS